MRINKYLAMCELGSRRKVESLVLNGEISVNDKLVLDLSFIVQDGDIVKHKNKLLSPQKNKVYYMLNKPKCYITSLSDDRGRKTVMTLLSGVVYSIFPVGRLDYNTEGLLILTNDGDFANSVVHPSAKIGKTYEVITARPLLSQEITKLSRGVVIDGVKTLPAKVGSSVQIKTDNEHQYRTNITIFEGRNREVRKMFKAVNAKVYGLKRVAIGSLFLGDLKVGKYRKLQSSEIELIFINEG